MVRSWQRTAWRAHHDHWIATAQAGYTPPMVATPDDRAERLAAALRDNLRRRKAQARAAVPSPTPAPAEITPDAEAPATPPLPRT